MRGVRNFPQGRDCGGKCRAQRRGWLEAWSDQRFRRIGSRRGGAPNPSRRRNARTAGFKL